MIAWVIIQNIGTAVFSSVAGTLADRRGNRLVLQIILGCLACVPPFAFGFACTLAKRPPSAPYFSSWV